jgi:hypothetical protein
MVFGYPRPVSIFRQEMAERCYSSVGAHCRVGNDECLQCYQLLDYLQHEHVQVDTPVTGPVGVPVLRWTEIYRSFELSGNMQDIAY